MVKLELYDYVAVTHMGVVGVEGSGCESEEEVVDYGYVLEFLSNGLVRIVDGLTFDFQLTYASAVFDFDPDRVVSVVVIAPPFVRGRMVYTLGYVERGAKERLERLCERYRVKVVDVRLSPRSRFLSDWRQGALQKRLGERYVHVPELGNVNYRDRSLPIEIADFEKGSAIVLDLLYQGWSVCLLCACSDVWSCHRLVVARKLVEVDSWLIVEHL